MKRQRTIRSEHGRTNHQYIADAQNDEQAPEPQLTKNFPDGEDSPQEHSHCQDKQRNPAILDGFWPWGRIDCAILAPFRKSEKNDYGNHSLEEQPLLKSFSLILSLILPQMLQKPPEL